jgi:uncharacterized membrane protein YhaH (DUF805 family)
MNWYVEVLKKYAAFDGRARRTEFWMFALINTIIIVVLELLMFKVGALAALLGLYSLAVLVPSIAVGVRRLHDTNRSGWWILIGLVPFVGAIILIVLMCLEGTPGDNQYGSNPKALAGV